MPPHCDSMDGPVVRAAQEALKSNDPNLVLPFVPASCELEVREAFRRTMVVRGPGAAARELADRWFYETVVRLHRAGEGAPFEGLKPAGLDVGPVVPMAERAIESGDLKPLYGFLSRAMHEALHAKFEAAIQRKEHDPRDVAAARAYTSAMLGFIVWSHHVYSTLSKDVHEESEPRPTRTLAHAQ